RRARAWWPRGPGPGRCLHRALRALPGARVRPLDLDRFPSIPRDEDAPVFREPWEAQAFGMTLVLHERGHFTWREWTDRLIDEITAAKARGEGGDGGRYYLYRLTVV